jgi:hypothetical protein
MWCSWLFIGLGLPVLFHALKLVVEVGERCISIRYVPILRRTIPFEEIESFRTRAYSPIREYGGWGIRWRGRKSRAYNVSGNEGIDLVLYNGEQILLGSQRSQELALVLEIGMRLHR